ncbi:NAD(P)-dependent oxidoreductase [Ornithinimicrobium tianjinense]|uniref:NAD-dependent epimerase n=1 Tax=Ornithinimicrobium tianjinense TaxID=1195761 RepID=A0A917BN15_9MICO|nr:NAD(P)H-binding protein [Ornithinimicrobium tianjinense]GGF52518.1 NAD-dependent epimerase [Ornithinimicrobium tianjinense]
MARIVIFGGTGYSGGNIAREAVSRGHEVVSYSRNAPAEPIEGVEYRTGSMADPAVVEAAAEGADQLVVALHAVDVDGAPMVERTPALVEAARRHGARLSFVGGAGSSLVAEGGPRLLDQPDFLDDWKPEATAHAKVLDALREAPEDLEWFYVSPAALYGSFAPGETTGAYRTGGDVLVTQEDGSSEISGTDLAKAYVDEIESGAHPRQRFTVGH